MLSALLNASLLPSERAPYTRINTTRDQIISAQHLCLTCLVRRGAGLLGALPLAGTRSWSWGWSKSSSLRVGKVS